MIRLTAPLVFADDELARLDALGQAALVNRGHLSVDELVQATSQRIETLNPRLNAVLGPRTDAPRYAAPGGPLNGVPSLVKDVTDYFGFPTSYGSAAMLGPECEKASAYARALRNAGLAIVGKSHTSELALLGTTESLSFGATRNPWDTERSTGGSSGGAVAAVASRMVAIAHANDGGGSIRGPASFTGLFGFKPSRGIVFSSGIPPDAPLGFMVSEHCVSRSVRDSAAWLDVTTLVDPGAPSCLALQMQSEARRLRIGLHLRDSFGREPDPDVAEAVAEVAAVVAGAGHEVTLVGPPKYEARKCSDAFFLLAGATVRGVFAQLKAVMGPSFSPDLFEPYTRALAQLTDGKSEQAFHQAMGVVQENVAAAQVAFEGVDVLMSPTVPFTAPMLGTYSPDKPAQQLIEFTERVASYTAISSMAGWCAMTVPLASSKTSGLPVGVHFSAPAGHDQQLFKLAFELERLRPWWA